MVINNKEIIINLATIYKIEGQNAPKYGFFYHETNILAAMFFYMTFTTFHGFRIDSILHHYLKADLGSKAYDDVNEILAKINTESEIINETKI